MIAAVFNLLEDQHIYHGEYCFGSFTPFFSALDPSPAAAARRSALGGRSRDGWRRRFSPELTEFKLIAEIPFELAHVLHMDLPRRDTRSLLKKFEDLFTGHSHHHQ